MSKIGAPEGIIPEERARRWEERQKVAVQGKEWGREGWWRETRLCWGNPVQDLLQRVPTWASPNTSVSWYKMNLWVEISPAWGIAAWNLDLLQEGFVCRGECVWFREPLEIKTETTYNTSDTFLHTETLGSTPSSNSLIPSSFFRTSFGSR